MDFLSYQQFRQALPHQQIAALNGKTFAAQQDADGRWRIIGCGTDDERVVQALVAANVDLSTVVFDQFVSEDDMIGGVQLQ